MNNEFLTKELLLRKKISTTLFQVSSLDIYFLEKKIQDLYHYEPKGTHTFFLTLGFGSLDSLKK
jgi:hypothetical protein